MTRPNFAGSTRVCIRGMMGALNTAAPAKASPMAMTNAGNAPRGSRPPTMQHTPMTMPATTSTGTSRFPPPHAITRTDPASSPIPPAASTTDAANPSPPNQS